MNLTRRAIALSVAEIIADSRWFVSLCPEHQSQTYVIMRALIAEGRYSNSEALHIARQMLD